jgi:thiamine pyrophosphate-dependent acetolactate synthase large subunit-like protein
MMNKHGGYLVARFLAAEQVPVIFTLCGGHIAAIYDGCIDFGLKVVDFRHEQAAAHAADAWARVTGQPGVAVVTAGPGVTGTVTAVANALRAGSPVVVLGGQGGVADFEKGALQELDHVELMRPITKWSKRCLDTRRIPEYLSMAFRHAMAGRPGPVFLELPVDVLFGAADTEKVPQPRGYRAELRPSPAARSVEHAARLLANAERPVVMAGSAVRWCEASRELTQLVKLLAAPCYLNGMGRGCLPTSHPNCLAQTRKRALAQADVVLLVGVPLDFRMHYGGVIGSQAKIIQVEMTAEEIGWNRGVELGIVGDAKGVLEGIVDELGDKNPSPQPSPRGEGAEWLASLQEEERKFRERAMAKLHSNEVPIHPLRFAYAVSQVVKEDTIVVGDGGEIVAIAAAVLPISRPAHWLDPGPLGCLGVGMPFAIAAKLARPAQDVLIIYGDGAFGLNGFEYDTAVRFNLPIVGVVGNDGGWGQIRRPQIQMFGHDRAIATALGSNAAYHNVAVALGGWGEEVHQPSDILPALQRAKESCKPALVNVHISDAPIDPTHVVDLSKV